jgi:hypothetical protein
MSEEKKQPEADTSPGVPRMELRPGDSYIEGEHLVFTAQYHLRRGSCCHSGCRHCPYGEANAQSAGDASL